MDLNRVSPTYTRLFTDAEIEKIYAGAVSVLVDTGFRIQGRTILERLEQHGARVDYSAQVFWPTLEMVHALEDCARRGAPVNYEPPVLRLPIPVGEGVVYNAPLYYDGPMGDRRMATLQDVRDVLKACHGLPEVVRLGPALAAQDVPAVIEPLVAVAEAIKTTDKEVLAVELVLGEQLPFMEELETISRGEQVRYTTCGSSIDRFTIDGRGVKMLMTTWQRNGLKHWWVASCPIAGITAPMTIAGAITVGVAETLGGWFAGWAMDEGISLGLSPCSSTTNMRTTRVLFSTPEAVLIDVGQYQVFERLFGVQGQLLADYTDAKVPGMQAMNDKLFKSLSYKWLTSGPVNPHYGKLDAGKVFSPTQMVIDFEINRELSRLRHGVEVTDESLALDLIRELALNHSSSFLSADHTLHHFREASWEPLLMDQTSWADSEGERQRERQMIEKAETRWRKALTNYEPPDIPKEKISAVAAVIARASQTLL